MKWRTILGVAVGLLLPLPFMLLQSGSWTWEQPAPPTLYPGARLVPVLPPDKRRELLTFVRACQTSKDCEPPLACLGLYPASPESVCLDSECMTDLQCKPGFTCRTRKVPDDAALVRECVRIGTQQEGQPCFVSAARPQEACSQGLFCGSSYCGRPCQLEVPSSCPTGFVCRAGLDSPSCQPSCSAGGCPPGLECVGVGTDKASCMRVLGDNCQRSACAQGQQCVVSYTMDAREWSASMECLTPCDAQQSCSGGTVCFQGGCRRTCEPEARDVCGPRQHCTLFPAAHLWVCVNP